MPTLHPLAGSNVYGFNLFGLTPPEASSSLGGPWAPAVLTPSTVIGFTTGGYWLTETPSSEPETVYLRYQVRPFAGLGPCEHGRRFADVPDKAFEGEFLGTSDDFYNGWILQPAIFFDTQIVGTWYSGYIDGVWWAGTDLGSPNNNTQPESPYPMGGAPVPGGGAVFVPLRLFDLSDAAVSAGLGYEVIVQARYDPIIVGDPILTTSDAPMTGVGLTATIGFHVAWASCGARGGGFHFG